MVVNQVFTKLKIQFKGKKNQENRVIYLLCEN